MTAGDDALAAARRAFGERLGRRLTADEQDAFAAALGAARAAGTVLYRDEIEALHSAGRELLDAEEAYRFTPSLDNISRLARARRRLERAVGATRAPSTT